MQPWNHSFEGACRAQVDALCSPGAAPPDRERAWKALLVSLAPHIEAWVQASPLLRRCSLATPDDARAVLIDVIGRLRQHDFANLRRFRAAQGLGHRGDDEAELQVVERLVRLASDEAAPATPVAEALDEERAGTPLRGWLLGLTRFVIKDHVKQRMGWSRAPATPEDRGRSKRDLNSGAERFDDQPEAGERPPITDLLTLRRRLEDMRAYAGTFPPQMQQALELWMNDADFDEIARGVGVESAERARALVRAAQARLRERFRDPLP